MEMKGQSKVKEQSHDLMCIKCKMFFGNESFGRMCSGCFKKYGVRQAITKKQEEINPSKNMSSVIEMKEEVRKQEKKQINKDKCSTCNRKLKLLGIECRCGLFYCNSHRLPQDHKCTFNHKEVGKEKLSKEVIKVQNGKIQSF